MPTRPKKPELSKKEIGARLRQLRRTRGMNQGELAKLLGTHQTSISQIESGARGLSLHQAVKLSKALGVSIDELLGQGKASRSSQKVSSNGRVLRRLRRIEQLPQAERRFVLKIIEALVEKRSRATSRE